MLIKRMTIVNFIYVNNLRNILMLENAQKSYFKKVI